MKNKKAIESISRLLPTTVVLLMLLPYLAGNVSHMGNDPVGLVEEGMVKAPDFPDPLSVSWTDEQRLSHDSYVAEHPNVAASSQNVHVVWQEQRLGIWFVYHRKSPDNGVNFEDPEALTLSDTDHTEPAVAVNGKVAHVVYTKTVGLGTEIWYTRNEYNGLGWFPKIRISQEATEPFLISLRPAIAVSGSYVHVVWASNADGIYTDIYYRGSSNKGGSWGDTVKITQETGPCGYPKIAASGPHLHVVWQDSPTAPYQVYYRKSDNYGQTWHNGQGLNEDRLLSTGSGAAYRPSVAVATDQVYVTWRDTRTGNSEVFGVRSTDSGYSWIEERLLSDDTGASSNPTLAASGNNVHVLWPDNRNNKLEIFYKRSTDDFRTFGTDTQIAEDAMFDLISPVTSVFDNNIHVVWINMISPSQIWYKHKILDDESWNQFDVSFTTSRTASYPSLDASSKYVHVLWQDNRNGHYDIYYRRSDDFGQTWHNGMGWPNEDRWIYGFQYATESVTPKIVVDGRYLYVVFAAWDGATGTAGIYFCMSLTNGYYWDCYDRISEPIATTDYWLWPAIAMSGDKLHVVWNDDRSSTNEIYYRRSTDRGLTWDDGAGNPQDRQLSSYPGTHSAIAPDIAVNGYNLHVAWQDNRDGNNEIYYKRSPDEGATWNNGAGDPEDKRLTEDPGDSIKPRLALFENNIHVAWCDYRNPTWGYDVYYKRSTHSGSEWEPDLLINDVSPPSFPPIQSCESQSGYVPLDIGTGGNNVYMVWQDRFSNGETKIISKRSSDDGETWDPEAVRFEGVTLFPEMPAICVDDVNVYTVWVFLGPGLYSSVELSRKKLDDNSWEKVLISEEDGVATGFMAVAANLNNIHLVFWDDYNNQYTNQLRYRRSTDFGATWDIERQIYLDLTYETSPWEVDIAVNGPFVHVVFRISNDFISKDRIVYRRSIDNGDNWGGYVYLDDSPYPDHDYRMLPAIAASGESVHVVWMDARDPSSEIYYRRSVNNGQNWDDGMGNPTDFRLTNDPSVSLEPKIAANGYDIHVAWSDGRSGNDEIYHKMSPNNGGTWGSDSRVTEADGESRVPNIAVVRDTVHLAWCDDRNPYYGYDVYYKKSLDKGAQWTDDLLLNNDYGTRETNSCFNGYKYGLARIEPGLSGNGNNVYTTWHDTPYDGYPETIYNKKSGSEGDLWWQSEIQSQGEVGPLAPPRFPDLATADNNVAIVWTEFDLLYPAYRSWLWCSRKTFEL